MSSIGEMHKAKAQSLFTHYMREATGYTHSDNESEWDEIIDRIINAAVSESKEVYASPPATKPTLSANVITALEAQAVAMEKVAAALDAIARTLQGSMR